MKETSKPESGVKIQRLRLITFCAAALLVATMIGGAAIAVNTSSQLNRIQSDWLEFRQITANKGQSLSQIRNYFGFGGFIHSFQNFITQRDPDLGGIVQRDLDELRAAVSTYEIVGTSGVEKDALFDLRRIIASYQANLAEATRRIRSGTDRGEIDRLASIDVKPALAALSKLEIIWLENLDTHTKQLMMGVSAGELSIRMTILFLPVLALVLIMLLWFMRRLVSVTVETVKVDHELRESEVRNRQFVADVAHELRTPLAVMRLNLENLKSSDTTRSLLEDVEKISRMLEQLLAVAKLESSPATSAEIVDLHEICVAIGADMAPLAIKEARSIEVRAPEAPILIKANRFAIEQAVRNLVENSLKYSARETKVVIEVTSDPAIKVSDKGPGIAKEMRESVFDPFLRSDRRGGGAGLGLSIVRRAAEVHEASIDIGDAPGGGSVFTITFPTELASPAP